MARTPSMKPMQKMGVKPTMGKPMMADKPMAPKSSAYDPSHHLGKFLHPAKKKGK